MNVNYTGVTKIENNTDGLWVVPPLPIAQRLRPYIPRDSWPDLVREKDARVPVQELAKRWDVSPITIWHTIQKARQQGGASDAGRSSTG